MVGGMYDGRGRAECPSRWVVMPVHVSLHVVSLPPPPGWSCCLSNLGLLVLPELTVAAAGLEDGQSRVGGHLITSGSTRSVILPVSSQMGSNSL